MMVTNDDLGKLSALSKQMYFLKNYSLYIFQCFWGDSGVLLQDVYFNLVKIH